MFIFDNIPLYKWLRIKSGNKKKYTEYSAECDPDIAKALVRNLIYRIVIASESYSFSKFA